MGGDVDGEEEVDSDVDYNSMDISIGEEDDSYGREVSKVRPVPRPVRGTRFCSQHECKEATETGSLSNNRTVSLVEGNFWTSYAVDLLCASTVSVIVTVELCTLYGGVYYS